MLFKDILTNQATSFRIGGLVVSAQSNSCLLNEPVSIPGSFMAFAAECDREPDICFVYDDKQTIERGRELFRADNFMNNAVFESGDHAWEYLGLTCEDSYGMDCRIEKDFTHILCTKMEGPSKLLMRELGVLFEYALLHQGACMLHGVLMEYQGHGILILARSGVGKSTHAHLWRDYENALILNGDRCLCRKVDEKWYGYGSPWCGTSGEYINRRVPITDIVFLDRGTGNRVVPMPAFEGTIRLLESVKAPNWERSLYVKAMDRCDELARDIPMWHLACTPDAEAVRVLKQALFGMVDAG